MQSWIEERIERVLPIKEKHVNEITCFELVLFKNYILYIKHIWSTRKRDIKHSKRKEQEDNELLRYVNVCLGTISNVSCDPQQLCYMPDYLYTCVHRLEQELLLIQLSENLIKDLGLDSNDESVETEVEYMLNSSTQTNVQKLLNLLHVSNVQLFIKFLESKCIEYIRKRKKRREQRRQMKQFDNFRSFLSEYRRKLLQARAISVLQTFLSNHFFDAFIQYQKLKYSM
jgi:hypothetical protein